MKAIVLVAIAAWPLGAQSTANCDRGGVMTPGGIGPLRVGMSADSLPRICRVIDSSRAPDHIAFRVLVGPDTVRVFALAGAVSWIEVTSRSYRMSDSLGVGSPVGPLLDRPEMSGGPGDGTDRYGLAASSGPLCGLTFWLEPKVAEMANAMRRDSNIFRQLQMRDPGVIDSIDIRGSCTGSLFHLSQL